MIFLSKYFVTPYSPIVNNFSHLLFHRQEQILRDLKATAEAAQLVLAEEAKRSAEALKAKCSLVLVTNLTA